MSNHTILVRVAARSERVVDVNSLVAGTAGSIVADADRAVLVERTLSCSTRGYRLTTREGAPGAATSWLFAEPPPLLLWYARLL